MNEANCFRPGRHKQAITCAAAWSKLMGSDFHRGRFLGSLGLVAASGSVAPALLKALGEGGKAALTAEHRGEDSATAGQKGNTRLRLQVVRTLVDPVIDLANPDTRDIPGGF